jgi:peptidoglycan hydrolase-like protein with peptidoglycan-binding domain
MARRKKKSFMTAATLTHLPVAAGGALLAATGNALHWGFSHYMRAPLANTAVLAMVTFSAMAGSNALYNQRHQHPAPLFAPAGEVTRQAAVPAEIIPVVPATRHKKPQLITPIASQETTGSVNPAAEVEPKPIGRAEVTEIQRKLHSMQIYDGAIDGLYGPQTARAIKTFEERSGKQPKGKVTLELLEAVRSAPVILPEPAVEPLPTPDPLPEARTPAAAVEALPMAEPEPAEEATTEFRAVADKPTVEANLEPLPAPAPLQLAAEPVAKAKRRAMPDTPEEALDLVVDTAGQAFETIADGVQSLGMTTPPKKKPKVEVRPAPGAAATPVAEADPIQTASIDPQVGVPLAMPEEAEAKSSDDVAVLDTDAKPEELMPPFSVTDPVLVAKVQRGLASLGFLYGPADGVAGEATAKAIRNFEVYYNYKVTGRISPELLDLLVQNGASI